MNLIETLNDTLYIAADKIDTVYHTTGDTLVEGFKAACELVGVEPAGAAVLIAFCAPMMAIAFGYIFA